MRAPFGFGRRTDPDVPGQRHDETRGPQGDAPCETSPQPRSATPAPLVAPLSPLRGTSPELPTTRGQATLLLDEPGCSSPRRRIGGSGSGPPLPPPRRCRSAQPWRPVRAGTTVTPSSAAPPRTTEAGAVADATAP